MPPHTLLVRHAQKNSKFVPRQMFRFNTQSISDVASPQTSFGVTNPKGRLRRGYQ